jgi:hypothetical protein
MNKTKLDIHLSAIDAARNLLNKTAGSFDLAQAKLEAFEGGGNDPLDWPLWSGEFEQWFSQYQMFKSLPAPSAVAAQKTAATASAKASAPAGN